MENFLSGLRVTWADEEGSTSSHCGGVLPAVLGSRAEAGRAAAPQCPRGHELQAWAARQGFCDGCQSPIQEGDHVMDCRWCDWYLCKMCLPFYEVQGTTLWGAISSLPLYAMDAAVRKIGNLLVSAGLAPELGQEDLARMGLGEPKGRSSTAQE